MRFEDEWATALNRARDGFIKYVVLRDPDEASMLACWVAATHIADSLNFAPRLAIKAPTQGCGKTTTLRVTKRLVHDPDTCIAVTPAVLFRSYPEGNDTNDLPPTLLIDEAKDVLGAGRKDRSETTEAIEQVINAGFGRGDAQVKRCGGSDKSKIFRYNVFGFVALAGVGEYLTSMVHSRAVSIWLDRADGKSLSPNRDRHLDEHLLPIRQRFEELAGEARKVLKEKYKNPNYTAPQPEEITDGRRQDVWDSLFEVADLAGDFWGKRIREIAVNHEKTHSLPEAQPMHMRLIFDAYEVVQRQPEGEEWISAQDLITALKDHNAEEWFVEVCLSKNKLARFLRQTGIRPKKRRHFGQAGIACYEIKQIVEKAQRYLADQMSSESDDQPEPEPVREYDESEFATETPRISQQELVDEFRHLQPAWRKAQAVAGTAIDPFAGGWPK